MQYEEKIDSKGVGYGLIFIGAFFTLIPFGWLSFVGSKDDLTFNEVIEKTFSTFSSSIIVILVFILFFSFAGFYFVKAYQEINANGDWCAKISNDELFLLSPSEKIEKSITISINEINYVEKIVKDIGDNDESITWTFFLNKKPVSFKHFGVLNIETLVDFLIKNHSIKLDVRNFDVRGNEI
ncbi:hypothetical protein B0W48_13660 [Pseudoalteromonas aliena]|uniref:Uncharacterized protein n=1 Tax=Pseudoalteromonas aliena TaxID=247523 RepID=A0A1Q2H074_9GAMM|nr:hypothetical protein [Pseudoalteromonas aliena]AQQ00764.1 hypothetical protein B0W48_13660 [Pseudoalteromonas aliena]